MRKIATDLSLRGGGAQIRREDSAAIEACSRRQLPLVDQYAPTVPLFRV